MNFIKPIHCGAIFTIYTNIKHIGNSSIKVDVDVQVKDREPHKDYSVTKAIFTFVLVDELREPRNVREVIRDDIDDYVKDML